MKFSVRRFDCILEFCCLLSFHSWKIGGFGCFRYMQNLVQRVVNFGTWYMTTLIHVRSISVHVTFGIRLRYIISTVSVTIYRNARLIFSILLLYQLLWWMYHKRMEWAACWPHCIFVQSPNRWWWWWPWSAWPRRQSSDTRSPRYESMWLSTSTMPITKPARAVPWSCSALVRECSMHYAHSLRQWLLWRWLNHCICYNIHCVREKVIP